jgi:hypothetical protein
MYANITESNITAHINNLFTFFKYTYWSNFSSILIIFHKFCTWIALSDADFCFSLILVRKANDINTLRPRGVYILRGLSSHQSGALLSIYSTNIRTEYFKHAA